MGNPKKTGISGITGKVLYIRHATESERADVGAVMKKRVGEEPDLTDAEVVVASQDDRILGFAMRGKTAGYDGGCISLFEVNRHRGIGKQLLRHLIDHSTAKEVVADRESGRYLTKMGYQRRHNSAQNRGVRRSRLCGNLTSGTVFRYERG